MTTNQIPKNLRDNGFVEPTRPIDVGDQIAYEVNGKWCFAFVAGQDGEVITPDRGADIYQDMTMVLVREA